MHIIFIIVSAFITVGAVVPYLLGILKGKTKPNIVSWTTWTLLTAIATAAEFSVQEYLTAFFTLSATIATLLIVIFGLKYGYAKYSNFDFFCQMGAFCGLVLWWYFNDPVLAVMASVTIDFVGALPTIRHSLLLPCEEKWSTYALSSLGGFFAVLALTSFNWISASYPIYIVLSNFLLFLIIFIRTKRI